MKFKLEATENFFINIGHGKGEYFIKEGDVLITEFSNEGISILLDGCWCFPLSIDDINDTFKVYNQ